MFPSICSRILMNISILTIQYSHVPRRPTDELTPQIVGNYARSRSMSPNIACLLSLSLLLHSLVCRYLCFRRIFPSGLGWIKETSKCDKCQARAYISQQGGGKPNSLRYLLILLTFRVVVFLFYPHQLHLSTSYLLKDTTFLWDVGYCLPYSLVSLMEFWLILRQDFILGTSPTSTCQGILKHPRLLARSSQICNTHTQVSADTDDSTPPTLDDATDMGMEDLRKRHSDAIPWLFMTLLKVSLINGCFQIV